MKLKDPFQLLKKIPRNRTIWAETWWKHSRDAQYRFVWCFTIYSGIRWKVRNWNTEQDYGKPVRWNHFFPISRIKWTNKNPNLENRIVKNISNHSFFGTKQKYHENFNVQHMHLTNHLSKMRHTEN
jgi:hypothetical protein